MKKILVAAVLIATSCSKSPTEAKKIPQIIVAPKVTNITSISADIRWETDVSANSTVRYGTAPGQLGLTVNNSAQETVHFIRLTALKSGTTYYYTVTSENQDGASSSAEAQFITLPNLDQVIAEAWAAYQEKNYSLSISRFTAALEQYPTNAAILTGLGWCHLAAPVDSLIKAVGFFDKAILSSPSYADALAGRGFALLALKKYNAAIEDLFRILSINPAYVFDKNNEVTVVEVRLALAMAYFYKQDFPNTQAQLNHLAPNNGLDPQASATWVVDAMAYDDYAGALLAWLEKVRRG